MDRWGFNIELFDCLPDILDTTVAKLAKRSGLCQQTLNRYMLHEIRVSVQTIMSLCNALRMPAYYFVCKNNEMILPEREHAILSPSVWKKIVWDIDAVERIFGDGPGQIYWKDAAAAMNLTSQKSHKRFRLETRFPMDDFLLACTNLQISPFRFMVDMNRPEEAAHRGGVRRQIAVREDGNGELQKEVASLRQEMESAKAKIDILTARFDDLTERYSTLLAAHNTFAHRIGIAIHSVSDSSINIAAETDSEYKKTKRTREE